MEAPTSHGLYTTLPNLEIAREIARAVLQQKLAACVNILPNITSLYAWDDTIIESNEVIAIFKTTAAISSALHAEILRMHPYTTPCVLSFSLACNTTFAIWLENCTKTVASAEDMR
jgi:periplasmic divalent cation tolerance protein